MSNNSAHGCIDLDISPPFDYFTEDETQKLPKSSSNRSLTLLPSVTAISQAPSSTSLAQKPVNNPISIRRGSRCVFDLAKKFEERLRKKEAQKTLNEEKAASSPLEILFPPLPQIQTVRKEDLKSLKSTSEQQQVVQISKLDYTPTKKERVVVKQEVEVTLD
uniref:Uncharacterized protein n=1 Tax=Caenorhabditis japonica TaxID=281687 RepID=A0A8R1EP82_CAEJA